jgi:8-oxo-dGTP diphosphatase
MTDSAKGHAPILAAGGIVLRGNTKPRFAVVRMRREKSWVLPKGKLMPREHPRDAAKREVLEETGYDVSIHDFLGSIAYPADSKVKIVQFWLMRASGLPVAELSNDVKAVKWLPLGQAVDILTRPHEKVFLTHVGPIALRLIKKTPRRKTTSRKTARRKSRRQMSEPVAPHVIAMDYQKSRPSALVKALGSWVGRGAQALVKRTG